MHVALTSQRAVKDIHRGEVHPPLEVVQGQGNVLCVGLHDEGEHGKGTSTSQCTQTPCKLLYHAQICRHVSWPYPYIDTGMHTHAYWLS